MNGTDFEKTGAAHNDGQPQPWELQPGEPPDRYYWFRLYLSLPIPRKVAQVAKLIGTNTERSWMSKIASQWRWKQRAALLDAEQAKQIIIQSQMREQLLLDKVFEAQFQGMLDTTKALENAQIGEMNRIEARDQLTPLSRHQRGLLQIILQQNEGTSQRALEELNEIRLAQLIEERARIRADEIEEEQSKILELLYGDKEEQD